MAPSVPEFSRIVDVQDVPPDGAEYDISANSDECARLAERFGLVRLEALRAKLRLHRQARGAVRLSGGISAQAAQICVVTLEPVEERIEAALDIIFRPDFDEVDADDPEFDESRDLEPLTGETLDIGEIVSAEMALSLNPYPRTAGAEPVLGPGGADDPAESENRTGNDAARTRPFATLGALIRGNAKN
jgi:uncharacterized metal-binding protein YceD (DUF177 family)